MEIEIKLALPPRQAARIRRHGLLSGIKPGKRSMLSVYFDTPDFDLMRRGIAFRLRRIDYHWVQTLKAEASAVGAMSSRPEWETAVAGGASPDFAVLPQAAMALLHGIDLALIAPVFSTQFQRTTWQIGDGDDQAEVALDLGEIHAGTARQDISEVEIELKSGSAGFLFTLADQLLAQTPLQIEPRSKAERGYVLCGAAEPSPTKTVQPDIHQRQNPEEAWNAVMQAAMIQMVANVPGFLERAQDLEYLHQLRIALRRLRAGLSLAKRLPSAPGELVQPLRRLMRGLNPARDWDVFLHETLPQTLAALGEDPTQAREAAPQAGEDATLELIRETAMQQRQQAQDLLRSPEFTRLVLDLGRALMQASETGKAAPAAPGNAQAWAANILEKRWLALRKRCRHFARLNPNERHLARIAAKKMRYAADAFLPLYGKRGARFVAALAQLQNVLGSANDAHVGAQMVRELPMKNVAIGFNLGRIEGALQVEAARHANLSAAVWRRLAQSRRFWRN